MKDWNPHYKTLDHWRGFAALWVMIFHGFATLYDKPLNSLTGLVRSIAAPGWLGVHIFFVISGYCIGANVYKLISKNGTSWDFLKNRLWRLMPTYWLAFVLTIIIGLLSSPFNKTNLLDAFPSSLQSWVGNLFLIQPYLNVPFYLVVYWSLAVELGFYAITFSLLLIRNKINKNLAFILAIGLGFISVFIPDDPRLGLFKYYGEFLLGALVFIAVMKNFQDEIHSRNTSLLLIVFFGGVGQYMNIFYAQENQMLFSASFAMLIYFAYGLDSYLSSLKFIGWLKIAGIMSYSLYLLHVPLEGRIINLGLRYIST